MTILECEDCSHKFLSKDVELTNVEITNEYLIFIGIVQNVMQKGWNCSSIIKKATTTVLTMTKNNFRYSQQQQQ
jgi:hypothetical protein